MSEASTTPATIRAAQVSGDEDLLKLQDQAVEYISEAKRRDPSGPNELVSSVIDAVARDYVGHVIRKQRRRAGET